MASASRTPSPSADDPARSDPPVNDRAYWNDYFSEGQWEKFDGPAQTRFFAHVAFDALSEKHRREFHANKFSILDAGCAEGDATDFLAEQFPESRVLGVDFAAEAIQRARKHYPHREFAVADLEHLPDDFDVVFCSNVLEHFPDPAAQMQRLTRVARVYLAVLVPFEEENLHESHAFRFDASFFNDNTPTGFELDGVVTVDTASMSPSYWPGQQALALYRRRSGATTGAHTSTDLPDAKDDTSNFSIPAPAPASSVERWDLAAHDYVVDIDDRERQLGREIARFLQRQGIRPGARLLEAGCGSGHLSAVLAQEGYATTLVDFSPRALEKARQTYARYNLQGEFVQGDLTRPETFAHAAQNADLVWNSGVMEHFPDDTAPAVFAHLARVARERLFILVPNARSVSYRLMRYVRQARDDWPYGDEFLRDNYPRLLADAGFPLRATGYFANGATKHNFRVAVGDALFADAYDDLLENDMLPQEEKYLVGYFAVRGDASSATTDGTASRDASAPSPQAAPPSGDGADADTRIFDLHAERYGLLRRIGEVEGLYNTVEGRVAVLAHEKRELEADRERLNQSCHEVGAWAQKLQRERDDAMARAELAEERRAFFEQEAVKIGAWAQTLQRERQEAAERLMAVEKDAEARIRDTESQADVRVADVENKAAIHIHEAERQSHLRMVRAERAAYERILTAERSAEWRAGQTEREKDRLRREVDELRLEAKLEKQSAREAHALREERERENAVLHTRVREASQQIRVLRAERDHRESRLRDVERARAEDAVGFTHERLRLDAAHAHERAQDAAQWTHEHERVRALENAFAQAAERIRDDARDAADARDRCRFLIGTKGFQAAHFLTRFRNQFLHGPWSEKVNFARWLTRKGSRTEVDSRQPLLGVIHTLERAAAEPVPVPPPPLPSPSPSPSAPPAPDGAPPASLPAPAASPLRQRMAEDADVFRDATHTSTPNAERLRRAMDHHGAAGILVAARTTPWSPLGTTACLLRAFAARGWFAVYAVDARRAVDPFGEVEPNLYLATEDDIVRAAGDRPVVVLAEGPEDRAFADAFANRRVWIHLTRPPATSPLYDDEYASLCAPWIHDATWVSYATAPLAPFVGNRADALLLEDGAPDDLPPPRTAGDDALPDPLAGVVRPGRAIFGYAGPHADGLDVGLLTELAIRLPDREFVVAGGDGPPPGDPRLSNLHWLGRMDRASLVRCARRFDVAMLPWVDDGALNARSRPETGLLCGLGLPTVAAVSDTTKRPECDCVAVARGPDEFAGWLEWFLRPDVQATARRVLPMWAAERGWRYRVDRIAPLLHPPARASLADDYHKHDVIVLGIIDYDFRHQRPQHFAQRFARAGHRTFYVNANFSRSEDVREIEPNLFVVSFLDATRGAIYPSDWNEDRAARRAASDRFDRLARNFAIADAVVVVDYPNWVHVAEDLRERRGFRIVADYMDDFTGFITTADQKLKVNAERLLDHADRVIASSDFLHRIAKTRARHVDVIRNGAECAHFEPAYRPGPDPKGRRPVIGYYGAVAEWFDAAKVRKVAEAFPECDVVVVGNVTAHQETLQGPSNLRLTGEIPYADLPPHLREFDVCLIPFDTSTDLIKATNPVKFYEYLAAGKKVVATDIPELADYRDRYVRMADDDAGFIAHVRRALAEKDTPEIIRDRMEFAHGHDWDARFTAFAESCRRACPKIGVVVLTYNNLKYTRACLESVLTRTAYPHYELVVVDNASTDRTRDWLRDWEADAPPFARVVLNDGNLGFAAGNNVALRLLEDVDYAVLLNNDTRVTRGWLTTLTCHMEKDPSLGMVGPVTNNIGNEAKIPVWYASVAEMDLFAYDRSERFRGERYAEEPSALAMFCAMIRRSAMDRCGLLDERFRVGMFEDDDYALTLREAGYRLAIAEDAFVHHVSRASFGAMAAAHYAEIFERNKTLFDAKWASRSVEWTPHTYRPNIPPDSNGVLDK